ncbi:hypothetical protein Q3G72_009647 [Acer saccharum]|nr:hypothetical protein Q3G72_009647 [Acer saccharum]
MGGGRPSLDDLGSINEGTDMKTFEKVILVGNYESMEPCIGPNGLKPEPKTVGKQPGNGLEKHAHYQTNTPSPTITSDLDKLFRPLAPIQDTSNTDKKSWDRPKKTRAGRAVNLSTYKTRWVRKPRVLTNGDSDQFQQAEGKKRKGTEISKEDSKNKCETSITTELKRHDDLSISKKTKYGLGITEAIHREASALDGRDEGIGSKSTNATDASSNSNINSVSNKVSISAESITWKGVLSSAKSLTNEVILAEIWVSRRRSTLTIWPSLAVLAVRRSLPGRRSKLAACRRSTLASRAIIMEDVEMMRGDKLILRGLKFHGFHGVNPEERKLGQKFLIDIDAWMDLRLAGKTDNISDTVSYTDIYRISKEVLEGQPQNLLESVAQLIASATLAKFPQISAVRVKVGKPHVAVHGALDYLGVEIFRYRSTDVPK